MTTDHHPHGGDRAVEMDSAWSDAVAGEIRAIAARRGISHAEIARRIDRVPMWLSRRLSPSTLQPMSIPDLTLIAGALGVDPADVLAAARPTTTGEAR